MTRQTAVIPLEPFGKARPRVTRTGHAYMPDSYVAARDALRLMFGVDEPSTATNPCVPIPCPAHRNQQIHRRYPIHRATKIGVPVGCVVLFGGCQGVHLCLRVSVSIPNSVDIY